MSRKIWKFTIDLSAVQGDDAHIDIQMPLNAEIVHIDTQYNLPCLWAIVDDTQPGFTRRILVRGTGHEIPDDVTYLGSAQTQGGILGASFVWHFFA